MEGYKQYRKKSISWLRPYVPGEDLAGVAISELDRAHGSPTVGDFIACDPKNQGDKWLVSAAYAKQNFEPAEGE